ncbi:Uncharacterised protein [Actinomyces bovis]|uniref:Ribbon-helix-helix protein CopG domain-containing protein n=1 Tax=Actinomyces bovis TaxID=1658 RepID=A0ABY1VNM0_9ACTO|nr:ribbon-helix-helix protein, CopG family [Actinomyces bovis]SPT53703.1 Uncharacterised protein [Actinomyces bovis]VEG55837.1 Uncharacterised protein [Actinomyces israelii]
MTIHRTTFSDADQAYYDQLDEDVTAGLIPTIARGAPRDGSRISDEELDAILGGRPNLGEARATGKGRSPRRQVRLPEATSDALDAYAAANGTTPSAVMREALEAYLQGKVPA